MGYTASRVIKLAQGELGYKEKASNSQLDDKTANAGSNNWTKYARDLYKAGYYNGNKNGYAWCDVFVDWLHLQAANGDAKLAQATICQTGDCGAGCSFSAQYYRNQNRFFTKEPRPGDQVFFGKVGAEEHTGIVESVNGNTIVTIEGNTSNCVARRTYNINGGYVCGFGRPKYADADVPATTKPTTSDEAASGALVRTYTVRRGDSMWAIAMKLGCTLAQLVDANPQVSNPSLISVGQVLNVPGAKVDKVEEQPTKEPVKEPAKEEPTAAAFEVGDKVRIKSGSPVYGKQYTFSPWVYNTDLYIREVKDARVVVSTQKAGPVTGPVHIQYLTKV